MHRPHPFLDWPGPIPFAHRGGASDAAENTMEAFEFAVNLGYRYVETDVHVTNDGVLVAFHDDDLGRVCDRPGLISTMAWNEVSAAVVEQTSSVPMLEEILGTWPDLRVNIDCKSDRAVPGLVSAIRRTGSLERVCIASFSDRRIARLAALLGVGTCTALASRGVAALRVGAPVRGAALCAQVPVKHGPVTVVDQRFIERAHRRGIQVHVWTVDSPDEMARLLDLGVDGIMTDRPIVLRDVLRHRGAWVD